MCCSEITAQKPDEFFCEMCQIMRISGMWGWGGITWVSPPQYSGPAGSRWHHVSGSSCFPSKTAPHIVSQRSSAAPARCCSTLDSAAWSSNTLCPVQPQTAYFNADTLENIQIFFLTDLYARTVGQIVRKREREHILLVTACHLNTRKWNHAGIS